ncbi:ABC transporter ATP-binding protein [Fusibacter ferrireducens]|uniref:ABC transporter ATP-binding protein n=1 Tax=Fusibacter ferrireducens TaxID=2785058 RepID=A0ABR9ZPF3_9FIRM|nr:ABC transporter ATP-binding protein [Fusibacter ferrireducens]MBF4692337.1 ABC transporter ATP-binding protein [Fusibacter ferrireducens]
MNTIRKENDNQKEVLLSVEHLRVNFKTDKAILNAVEDVSFKVYRGETLGIVGESGCGKSITCMSIMKLIQGNNVIYEDGKICFEDVNTLSLSDKALQEIRGKEIAYIFQEPMTALNPLYTIGNQMSEALRLHVKISKKEALKQCAHYLEKVKIPNPNEVLMRYPFSLSGGMRQRVMIAMALITNSKLIIADEPTTALDVTIQAQILDLMKELQGEFGCSYIFITHDLGVISEVSDRVAVMYGGRIVECADTDTMFEKAKHPYTIGLIASRPHGEMVEDRLPVIPGNVPSLNNKPQGCPFHPRCEAVMDQCRKSFPEAITYAPGHTVACWQYIKE